MVKLIKVDDHPGFTDSWYEEGAKVWRVREQHDRAAILDENQRVRQEGGTRMGDGMRLALQIPQDDYDVIIKAMPELAARDRETKHKAWQRFMRMDMSLPYRTFNASRGNTA